MDFRRVLFSFFFIAAISYPLTLSTQERVHVVQRGETIFSIAQSLGVDRNELMRVNGITDPTKLQAGQSLKIPGTAANETNGGEIVYRVVRGDTFYNIARQHGITVNQILAANSLSSDYILKEGDMLRIPAAEGVPAANPGTAPTAPASAAASRPAEAKTLDLSIRWPVSAKELSYMTGNIGGVIITGERAEPVKSLTSGTVISAGPYRGYGRIAIVQASGGYIYVYGGCEILTVKEGDKVGPGMEMGKLGIDAITEKPQLFFRVYLNNSPVDPAKAPRT